MTADAGTRLRLSVVIAAWNGAASLRRCLASLTRQLESGDTEVIVVSNYGAGQELEEQFPHVRYVRLAEDATVPELRAKGISCARGEVVALLEDHCTFDKRWCAEIKRAHQLPYPVVGGAVENASRERLLDWAVYFYDYGKYMLPNEAGVVNALSGNNVSYKGEVLREVEDGYRDGFFEAFVHEELQRRGHALYLMPSVIVYHNKNYVLRVALRQCYHLARSFAGRRVVGAPPVRRVAFALASFALPVLLPARIAARTVRKRRHIKELLMSAPHLLLLMSVWSFGEFCGYSRGEGASAREWK